MYRTQQSVDPQSPRGGLRSERGGLDLMRDGQPAGGDQRDGDRQPVVPRVRDRDRGGVEPTQRLIADRVRAIRVVDQDLGDGHVVRPVVADPQLDAALGEHGPLHGDGFDRRHLPQRGDGIEGKEQPRKHDDDGQWSQPNHPSGRTQPPALLQHG